MIKVMLKSDCKKSAYDGALWLIYALPTFFPRPRGTPLLIQNLLCVYLSDQKVDGGGEDL